DVPETGEREHSRGRAAIRPTHGTRPKVARLGVPVRRRCVVDPDQVRRWLEQSCASQGVPVKVTDPRMIARVVILLGRTSAPRPEGPFGRDHLRSSRYVTARQATGREYSLGTLLDWLTQAGR